MQVVKTFVKALNNVNFEINNNGELLILKLLSTENLNCVFDVGANVGYCTNLLLTYCPETTNHSFEIIPTTYTELFNNEHGKICFL